MLESIVEIDGEVFSIKRQETRIGDLVVKDKDTDHPFIYTATIEDADNLNWIVQ